MARAGNGNVFRCHYITVILVAMRVCSHVLDATFVALTYIHTCIYRYSPNYFAVFVLTLRITSINLNAADVSNTMVFEVVKSAEVKGKELQK